MRLAVIIGERPHSSQEGECINVGAGSAWSLYTGFPNSFTNNRLGCGHHNTKQVRKPKVSKKLLAFTRLRPQITDPTCLHFAPDVNRADCGPRSQNGLAVKHH